MLYTSAPRTIFIYTLLFLSLHPLWNSFSSSVHYNSLMCSRNTSILLCVCVLEGQQTTLFFQLQSNDYQHLETAKELVGKSLCVTPRMSANSENVDQIWEIARKLPFLCISQQPCIMRCQHLLKSLKVMEFCYVLGMVLACSNVMIINLMGKLCVLFFCLGCSYIDSLNYEVSAYGNQILNN